MDYSIVVPFWNQKHIPPPAIFSKKLPTTAGRKVSSLKALLSAVHSKLEKTKFLNKEAAVLSRLVYRMKRIFRQDKCFKYITMLLKALRNHLVLNLLDVIEALKNGCYENSCPSKEMIEWGLVSLMRFSSLFHRIHSLSELAASTIQERFSSGHYWKLAALCLGVISRLWALAGYYVMKACDWFSKMKTFLPISISSGEEWLPSDFAMPSDLAVWLGQPSYLSKPLRKPDSDCSAASTDLWKMLKGDAVQDESSQRQTKLQLEEKFKISNMMYLDEDLGETIERVEPSANTSCDKQPEKGVKRKEGKAKSRQKKKRKKVAE